MARWGVVGGGVLGLMLAHRLAGAGHDVTVIEGTSELGGLTAAWQIAVPGVDGAPDETVTWDRHYHVTLLSDRRTQEMVAAAGLTGELHWVSNTLEFLRLPGLNALDKLRLGGTIVYGSKIRDGKRMERIPVDAW